MLFLFAVSHCHGSSFASSRSKAFLTTSTWLQGSAASDSLGSQGSQIQRYLQGAALLQVAGYGGSHLGSDGTEK